jgi:exonuclease SbcC
MRPITLTMRAFGPYKDTEIVDFRELRDRNLFLITGPTGAGKTTLFDAISFAIYGEASGNMRSSDSLRSHFAAEDCLTEVELLFELKGISYHIHRIPKQMKLKLKGEGFMEQKPEATLTIYSSDPAVVVTGIKNVNEKIEDILGINAEQFKQIMMIPQGEFQKLLTASTEDRERVLQQLFDTSLYNQIQMKLEFQAKGLYSDIKKNKELRDHDIEKLDCGDNEVLQGLIKAEDKNLTEIRVLGSERIKEDQVEVDGLELILKQLSQAIESQIEMREKASVTNERLAIKETTEMKLKEKEANTQAIEALSLQVNRAEKALLIAPIEENVRVREQEIEKKTQDLSLLGRKIEEANNQEKATETAYLSEVSWEKEKLRERHIEEISKLKGFEDKVKRMEEITSAIAKAETRLQILHQDAQSNSAFIQEATKKVEDFREKSVLAKGAEIEALRKTDALSKVTEKGLKLKKLIDLQAAMMKDKAQGLSLSETVVTLQKTLEDSSKRFKKSKLDALMNQAAVLAKDLKEGDACPVCGATHHIHLAEYSETAVTEEQLQALEEQVAVHTESYHKALTAQGILESSISEKLLSRSEQLAELRIDVSDKSDESLASDLETLIQEARQVRKTLDDEVKGLTQEALGYESLMAQITELSGQLKTAETKTQTLSAQTLEVSGLLTAERSSLKHIHDEVPEAIRSEALLTEAIKKEESLQRESLKQLENARTAFDSAKNNRLTLETSRDQLLKYLEEAKASLASAKAALESKLQDSEFASYEDYKGAVLLQSQITALKATIDQHNKDLHTLKEQLEDLKRSTVGLEPIDLSIFEEQIRSLRLKAEVKATLRSTVMNRIQNNSALLRSVEAITLEIGDKEGRYKVVGNLARVARGDNKLGITFERYVLAAFLKDIVGAANLRLTQMTSGRYKLAITEERQRSNAKGGLDLEVYDNYTGKSRHVRTLSGGESFKASLSMALGLADIVQSYAGGVQLDTMFIDEGFGTLDQESLDSAISCLIDLQKTGRLVGIISHVQELKERVETRLEVVASQTGSRTRFVVG